MRHCIMHLQQAFHDELHCALIWMIITMTSVVPVRKHLHA